MIKDLQIADNVIYALTNNSIILYDEHGNLLEEKNIPETFNRIFVHGTTIFSFARDKKYFYKLNSSWRKIEFAQGISDISGNNIFIVILDGSGTNLYIYNASQIK